MRCFIAVEANAELEQEFKKAQQELKTDCAKQKFVDSFHLTLKFLEDVEENKIDKLISSLNTIQLPKFSSKLKQTGVFPNKNNPRVIWVGTEEQEFIKLQKEIESKLAYFGFRADKRFHPHFTLSRVRSINDKTCFTNKINSISVEEIKFEVNEFKLIKSTLTPQGPIYEELEAFSLI